MRRLICLLLLLPACTFAANPKTVGTVAKCPHLALGSPGAKSPGNTLIARRGYACLHSTKHKDPLWVSYYITKQDLSVCVPRRESFQADPNLAACAQLADYLHSGFDRGHMAPNRDMSRDVDTQAESFYLSNIVPQNGPNNREFWRHLEERFRDYVHKYGSLYIITGPIFGKPLPKGKSIARKTIGDGEVAVPTWLFKIAVRKLPGKRYAALAIEVPNLPVSEQPTFDAAMSRALTSIDQIEKDTGMNFLNALSLAEQKRIESKKSKMWK